MSVCDIRTKNTSPFACLFFNHLQERPAGRLTTKLRPPSWICLNLFVYFCSQILFVRCWL